MIHKISKKGFSLVELLVVITIIAVLSVVAYSAVGGQTGKARNSRRQQDLSTIQSSLEIFYIENNNKYPDQLDDGASGSANDLVPKYMPKMALDPATNAKYDYETNATNKKYQLGASMETDDVGDGYTAYIIGNSETDMIDGVTPINMTTPCNDMSDGDLTCIPYAL